MAFRRFFVTAILLIWGLTVLAYPQAKDLSEGQVTSPWTLSGAMQQISVPTNRTEAPPRPPARVGNIECFGLDHGRHTDVDGCRSTLNYFRGFPNYRLVQDFLEGRYPKRPSKPPYAVHHRGSNCAVQIASEHHGVIDKFSFEQARALATEILEFCQDQGGHGGYSPIGRGIGWRVVAIGFELPPEPPDGTGLLEGVGSGTGTSLPIRIIDT